MAGNTLLLTPIREITFCVNRAFLVLLHHHRPELVDIKDMQEGNAVENCTKAFSVAEV